MTTTAPETSTPPVSMLMSEMRIISEGIKAKMPLLASIEGIEYTGTAPFPFTFARADNRDEAAGIRIYLDAWAPKEIRDFYKELLTQCGIEFDEHRLMESNVNRDQLLRLQAAVDTRITALTTDTRFRDLSITVKQSADSRNLDKHARAVLIHDIAKTLGFDICQAVGLKNMASGRGT